MADPRLVNASRWLDQRGIGAVPSAAGYAQDVLALRAPIRELDRLRQLAPELKALGFSYVALELDAEESA
ncbi:MAG: hypothetical protein ACRENP_07075 [Longimicrobiales bacterium]